MVHADAARIHRCETQLKDFLDLALRNIPAERLADRQVHGKWSALENLAHLGRYHEIFLERLDRILKEDSPEFARYRAEDDPHWQDWLALSASDVLDRLRSLRLQLVAKLNQ